MPTLYPAAIAYSQIHAAHVRELTTLYLIHALRRLRVPELHPPVVPTRHELHSVAEERHVLDGLDVSVEGVEAVAVSVDVPELNTTCISLIT
jgi:hypothetical protein